MAHQVRDKLIDSTIRLVARNGVAGTGISELIADSRVARGSVYVNFPDGKAELVAEATRTAGEALSRLVQDLASRHGSGGSAVKEFAAIWRGVLESTDYDSGCPIVAATLGRHEAPAAAQAAGEVFTDWVRILGDRFGQDGLTVTVARDLATTVVAAIEGAVLISLATRSTEPLESATRVLSQLLDSTLPG